MRRPAFSIALALALLTTTCARNRAVAPPDSQAPHGVALGTPLEQARWTTPLVDTIIVGVATLDLRLGQVLNLSKTLHAEGHTAQGKFVAGFLPVYQLATNGHVVELTDRGLEAVGPGRATLIVLPLAAPRGRPVSTRVPITVH
jgi:hypothetical protein